LRADPPHSARLLAAAISLLLKVSLKPVTRAVIPHRVTEDTDEMRRRE
jgi:hypothetical protein